jgi:hypothetical protein
MTRRWLLLALLLLPTTTFAFDAHLIDALLSDDAGARLEAYEIAGALTDSDKINLAPFLVDYLEDKEKGERAAQALCHMGDVVVPYLDRHARTTRPGAEYADMGLLMEGEAGDHAMAQILRNGDPASVKLALQVMKTAGVMPPETGAEVSRLADEKDPAFGAAAKDALDAVAAAKAKGPKSERREASLSDALTAPEVTRRRNAARQLVGQPVDADTAKLLSRAASNESEDPDVRFYSALSLLSDQWSASPEMMQTLITTAGQTKTDVAEALGAALRSHGPAAREALTEALDGGKIDRSTYDSLSRLLGDEPENSPTPGDKFSPRQPDTSHFRTRQSAADSFSHNKPTPP